MATAEHPGLPWPCRPRCVAGWFFGKDVLVDGGDEHIYLIYVHDMCVCICIYIYIIEFDNYLKDI